MDTPIFSDAAKLGYAIGWPNTPVDPSTNAPATPPAPPAKTSAIYATPCSPTASAMKSRLDRKELDEASRNSRQDRNTAASRTPELLAQVKIRFLYQVLRAFPPQQVFAQALLAFEVASKTRASSA